MARARVFPPRMWTVYYWMDGERLSLRGEAAIIEALGHRDRQTVDPCRAELIMEAHATLDEANAVVTATLESK